MDGKEAFGARAARALELPQEGFSAAPRVTVSGASHVLVEGQRGLEEYGEERIAVALARGRLILRGEGLRLDAMSGTELAVSGRLWALEFE